MKTFKRIIAVFLMCLTIISGFSFAASAEEVDSDGWTELVCDLDETRITFNVPYKRISSGLFFSEPHYLVKTEGKAIEDCFVVAPSTIDESYYIWGDIVYLGFCTYDKDDDCYYAQCKILDPNLQGLAENYGTKALLEGILLFPLAKIAKAMDLKFYGKSYKYGEEHYNIKENLVA